MHWVLLNSAQPAKPKKKSEQFRRSIYVSNDIKSGDVFTSDNIKCVRPGFGLHTKYFECVLGQTATQSLTKGTPLQRAMVTGLDD